jgi:hypothetical protein
LLQDYLDGWKKAEKPKIADFEARVAVLNKSGLSINMLRWF